MLLTRAKGRGAPVSPDAVTLDPATRPTQDRTDVSPNEHLARNLCRMPVWRASGGNRTTRDLSPGFDDPAGCPAGSGSDRGPRDENDPPIRLLADRLGRDRRMIAEGEVDPAPLEGRHRLELEHLPGLHDPRRGTVGKLPQLAFPPAAVVLDVDEDPRPRSDLLGEHQVDQVLKGGQPLALAPDERAQGLLLVAVGDDVEPAR